MVYINIAFLDRCLLSKVTYKVIQYYAATIDFQPIAKYINQVKAKVEGNPDNMHMVPQT